MIRTPQKTENQNSDEYVSQNPQKEQPASSAAKGAAMNQPSNPDQIQGDQKSSASQKDVANPTSGGPNDLIIIGNRSLKSGGTASSAISKLQSARLLEMEKQEKILKEQAERENALIEAQKEAKLKQLEREAEERRLKADKEKLEQEANLRKLQREQELSKEQLNLSIQKQKILETASKSSRAGRSRLDVLSQSGSEKVKAWMQKLPDPNAESTPQQEIKATKGSKIQDHPLDLLEEILGIPVLNQERVPERQTKSGPELEKQKKDQQEKADSDPENMEKFVEAVCAIFDRKEAHRVRNESNQQHHNSRGPTTSWSRIEISRDLPKFDGHPSNYQIFRSHYDKSHEEFSLADNLGRLEKCLVEKSPAREAVKDLLNYPKNVPVIIQRLEMMFGQTEHVVTEIRLKIDGLAQISEKNVEGLVEFSSIVGNLVSTLESAEDEASLRSPELLRKIVKKLPPNMQFDWTKLIAGRKNVSIKDFSEWLIPIAEASLKLMDRSVFFAWKTPKESHSKRLNVHTEETEDSSDSEVDKCLFCKKTNHKLTDCKFFGKQSYEKKWKAVKRMRVCFKCLDSRHRADKCDAKPCGINSCESNHHKLLHKPKDAENEDNEAHKEKKNQKKEDEKEDSKHNCHMSGQNGILFKILPVMLHGKNGSIETFAFIDEGSSVSVIASSLVSELGIDGPIRPLSLKWTDGSIQTEQHSKSLTLQISGIRNGSRKYRVNNIRTVSSLDLPQQTLNLEELKNRNPQFKSIPVTGYVKAKPMMILGLEHYKLGIPLDVIEGKKQEPSVCKSRLGWYVYGQQGAEMNGENHMLHMSVENHSPDEDLHQLVKSFFTTENFGVRPPEKDLVSADNERALKIFEETAKRIDGRYECGLLWKFDEFTLPESLKMSQKRYESLERNFSRNQEYANIYQMKMEEYFEKGYARPLTDLEIHNKPEHVWYLPHFGVQHPNKPAKLRIVFDAAAKVGNVSLNSFLLTGPDLYVSLLGVLFRFREGLIAVAGDIREMFNRIVIRPEDQHVQRFLWRPKGEKQIKHCVFTSMFFGATCSPTIAQLVKNKNAEEFRPQFERAVKEIIQNHYVDDFLGSFDTEKEALEISENIKFVHSQGGFEIRNFISNSSLVATKLNGNNNLQEEVNLNLENETMVDRVLGMFWNLNEDAFVFKLNESRVPREVLDGFRKMTKREYLKVMMSLFDPMGFLGHLIVQAKVILQNIWKSGVEWDEELKNKEFEDWKNWWKLAKSIENLRIPRAYRTQIISPVNIQLHIFMDASERAFSAVAYWRFENASEIEIALIGSKTKVAPLKLLSIPRLELQAAVLAKRFAETIQKEHSIKPDQRFFWCDSKTVHCWINSRERNFKQFVAFRIGEILDGTETNEWRFVPSKQNVADVATKPNKELEVSNDQRWFQGPSFLKENQDRWPKEKHEDVDEEVLEIRRLNHVSVEDRGFSIIDQSRFSSWKKILRTTARVLKTQELGEERPLTIPKFLKKVTENLTVDDMEQAKEFLIKKAQWEVFAKEIESLEKTSQIPDSSSLKTLSPYLEKGILKVKGRIEALTCGWNMKRPIILPRKHKITFLIIDDLHRQFNHQMSEAVVNEMRQEFWVPRLRVEVNHVKSSCQVCKNQTAKRTVMEMGPLPEGRLSPFFRPFTHTGLDYFGPLEVCVGRRREKRWVALFTCLTIRAVHMEVVHSLSADSCLLAIRNFMNRRGCPKEIISDNGTSFKGADKELRKAFEEMEQSGLNLECTMKGIVWKTIPPYSPHKGGSWERMVRSVKAVVGKVLYQKALRDETLQSFLIEAEQIINSRPLTYVPLDVESDRALTPNDFLLQSSNGQKERWEFPEKLLRKQWKVSQELANHFWTRWVREYAPTILKRPKWFKDEHPLVVGDVVVILDEKLARNEWVKGLVIETLPGKDGKIRTVKLRTENGVRTRSVSNLVRLDVNEK